MARAHSITTFVDGGVDVCLFNAALSDALATPGPHLIDVVIPSMMG